MKNLSRDNYYIQTNNPTEQILKQYKGSGYLVSCGATAMINCIAPLGYDISIKSPSGKFEFQPEECVTDFLMDPRNQAKLNQIRKLPDNIHDNEVPQYYPYAAWMLFGATAKFEFLKDFEKICFEVANGKTAQICLKNPGHYIAIVDIKHNIAGTVDLLYNDPWPGRHEDGNGYMKIMTKKEYEENVKDFIIWYYPR